MRTFFCAAHFFRRVRRVRRVRRGSVIALILLSAVALVGCHSGNGDTARLQRQMDARPEMLFGATPPAMGEEDLGYFASLDIRRGQSVPFDLVTVYYRRTVYDVEDTRRPFLSYHRTRTKSVEQRVWLDGQR